MTKSDPSTGCVEALRRAMLAYIDGASNPRNAYPALGLSQRSAKELRGRWCNANVALR
jgi:hypothetical protein